MAYKTAIKDDAKSLILEMSRDTKNNFVTCPLKSQPTFLIDVTLHVVQRPKPILACYSSMFLKRTITAFKSQIYFQSWAICWRLIFYFIIFVRLYRCFDKTISQSDTVYKSHFFLHHLYPCTRRFIYRNPHRV